jgi:hypothetical protein
MELKSTDLDKLLKLLNELWKYHRDKIWHASYRPFGLEVLELRYGAIRTRLESLIDRIEDLCEGRTDVLPELEPLETQEQIYPGFVTDLVFDFSRAYTSSRALGTG